MFTRLKKFFFPEHFEVYTDGSFKNGRGAWAFVIVKNGVVLREGSGAVKNTTCNRMEFQAAVEALRTLPPRSGVTLYSDSRILITTLTQKMPEWKAQGWLKKNGRPIPSLDQVRALDVLNQDHRIAWRWIKAHSGILFNERCDELCAQARRGFPAKI